MRVSCFTELPRCLSKFIHASTRLGKQDLQGLLSSGAVSIANACGERVIATEPNSFVYPSQTVFVNGIQVQRVRNYTVALNKPRGMVTTCGPQAQLTQWLDKIIDPATRLSPIGRLDKETTGLLLVTSDGYLHNVIKEPGKVCKEYIAMVRLMRNTPFSDEKLQRLVSGVDLADGTVCALEADVVGRKEHRSSPSGRYSGTRLIDYTDWSIRVKMDVGKNRVVRRMFGALGYKVIDLHRCRIGPLSLDSLGISEASQHVELTAAAVGSLWSECGIPDRGIAKRVAGLQKTAHEWNDPHLPAFLQKLEF